MPMIATKRMGKLVLEECIGEPKIELGGLLMGERACLLTRSIKSYKLYMGFDWFSQIFQ